MTTVVISTLQAHPTAATLTVFAGMTYGFASLILGVARTASASSRHARFWSLPRPWRAFIIGRRSEAYRRREYAATKAKHTARPLRLRTSAAPVVTSHPDTAPWAITVPWERNTVPDLRQDIRQFVRHAA